MDYYNSRGRSSFRGGSSSYRGFRGSPRGTRGSSFSSRGSRGGGGGSSSSYPSKYSSTSYASDGSKYGSSSSYSHRSTSDDYYSRRTENFGTRERDHRSDLVDIASRKRDRSDSYSQGVSRRSHDDGGRYSDASAPRSSYDDSHSFKKPRSDFKPDYRSEERVREPLRTRAPIGRGRGTGHRGSFAPRRGRTIFRGRSSSFARSTTTGPASTSEILAIRRAKLLQKRQKEERDSADGTAKPESKEEGDSTEGQSIDTEAQESAIGSGKYMMKLECPVCAIKCVTFREYSIHLSASLHLNAMQINTEKMKSTLAAMRIKQREEQKLVEENDVESLETSVNYCNICKLKHSQEVAVHEASDMHKQLKNFLFPSCKLCRLDFQSPLLYEKHMCSLMHLKRKDLEGQRVKNSLPSSGILDRFMVLDSVGGGDEGDEKDEDKSADPVLNTTDDDDAENLNLGCEFIHDVLAKYCEVCCVYLRRRGGDYELSIKKHCRTKEHLRCYLHYGNEELLEKIKKSEKDKCGEADESLDDSKLWDGLNEEMLDHSDPTRVKSDDEDEEEGGRFDRINSKEKNENGEVLPKKEIDAEELAADGAQEATPTPTQIA